MKIKSLIMLAAAVAMVSCGGNASKSSTDEQQAEAAIEQAAMEIDALLTDVASLTNQQVVIEGICTHICSHGGRKIFLMGSDDTKIIRIEAAELGAFDQKCVNSIVKVGGILREERIDEEYLKQWEERIATNTADEHGDDESGCNTEKAARGETGNTAAERIADFRTKIAARNAAEGKEYLSFYFVEALAYEVVE